MTIQILLFEHSIELETRKTRAPTPQSRSKSGRLMIYGTPLNIHIITPRTPSGLLAIRAP